MAMIFEWIDTEQTILRETPSSGHVKIWEAWQGDQFLDAVSRAGGQILLYSPPAPDEALAAARAAWRTTSSLARAEFCTAAFRAGKMTAAEAIAAAKGETPALFESALSMLPPADQDEARILWAGLGVVERNHQLVSLAAQAADMTDEEVDTLFGWTG